MVVSLEDPETSTKMLDEDDVSNPNRYKIPMKLTQYLTLDMGKCFVGFLQVNF